MPSVSHTYEGMPVSLLASIRFKNGTVENMKVNGSVVPQVFTATIPEGYRLIANRCLFYLEGTTGFDSIKFGNLSRLTNGVKFTMDTGDIVFFDNLDIVLRCQEVFAISAFAKTDRQMNGMMDFEHITGGEGVYLQGSPTITIRDDLSLISVFMCEIQGELVHAD